MESRYWPGTTIVKSRGNDFNWQSRVSSLSGKRSLIGQQNATTKKAKEKRVDIHFAKEKS